MCLGVQPPGKVTGEGIEKKGEGRGGQGSPSTRTEGGLQRVAGPRGAEPGRTGAAGAGRSGRLGTEARVAICGKQDSGSLAQRSRGGEGPSLGWEDPEVVCRSGAAAANKAGEKCQRQRGLVGVGRRGVIRATKRAAAVRRDAVKEVLYFFIFITLSAILFKVHHSSHYHPIFFFFFPYPKFIVSLSLQVQG